MIRIPTETETIRSPTGVTLEDSLEDSFAVIPAVCPRAHIYFNNGQERRCRVSRIESFGGGSECLYAKLGDGFVDCLHDTDGIMIVWMSELQL